MLPRRFWVLVGWVIGLATLAGAAGVAKDTYADLYAIAGCTSPAPEPSYATCRDFRMMQGAAQIAGTVVKIPAFGLSLVAAAIGLSARRTGPKEAASEGGASAAGTSGATPGADPGKPHASGRARRSKAPSNGVISARAG